ncbi:MAG: YgfZ/GcvT domain-containing protein [Pseudomonadota bacterium]
MSDNPQYGDGAWFALPALRVVRLAGRDALAFAQAQFMNDVAALADAAWQWNGWLEPKGRVQALFALLRLDGETLWLVTTGDAEALAASLKRFVFRSKLSIELAPMRASGRLAKPAGARGAVASREADDAVEMDLSGEAGARTLRLSTGTEAAADDDAAWWALDIAHGWPALPGVALAAWTPQQLSLQRLQAFSVRKGCYPGQEIVARTHFLGRAKRGLARVRGQALAAGTPVHDAEGREVGQIVCALRDEALAVLPLDADVARLACGGGALAPLPLADGLQR